MLITQQHFTTGLKGVSSEHLLRHRRILDNIANHRNVSKAYPLSIYCDVDASMIGV